jgi:hypothetical protein
MPHSHGETLLWSDEGENCDDTELFAFAREDIQINDGLLVINFFSALLSQFFGTYN